MSDYLDASLVSFAKQTDYLSMNRNPTVSVVIPCFNDGRFLSEALESVLSQTLQPVETLVVNDGSTDPKTLKLLQKIGTMGARVIHQDNRGLGGARNTGLDNASGEYTYFCDADNVLYPECLATLAHLMETQEDAVAATSRIRILGGPMRGTVWCEPYNPYLLLVSNQWDAGIMLRREAALRYELRYDDSMHCHGYEDWDLNIRLGKIGRPVLFHPEPLYQYRVRSGSLLTKSRKQYVEILSYLREKHKECYEPETLLSLKRSCAPALSIQCLPEEKHGLQEFLGRQTFQDWVLDIVSDSMRPKDARYCFFHSGISALQRLPVEALECAMMALESNRKLPHCVIGVKKNHPFLIKSHSKTTSSANACYPIAFILRTSVPPREVNLEWLLGHSEQLVEFPDQQPGSKSSWDPSLLRFKEAPVTRERDIVVFRKKLSAWGKKLFGDDFHRRCVGVYDQIYGTLISETGSVLRGRVRSFLGEEMELPISRMLYGLFLMRPPSEQDIVSWKIRNSQPGETPPLFIQPKANRRVNLLICTAWLNEGGVEQGILDLCRGLDQSRFKIIIATTLPSSHSWDHLAREAGASVYHLANVLSPTAEPHGLVHLILNHHIDCLYIIHSRIAYETLKLIKQIFPGLSIIDRNEVIDPGGGYPLISAEVGRSCINLRTVGHKKLAQHMYQNHGLAPGSLRVIYAGTDTRRIEQARAQRRKLLHTLCNLPSDTPIIAFVGRFTPQKRPAVFVRIVASILRIQPECDARFAMIGDGELRPEVATMISKLRLNERVHLLGAHSNAVELLADATLLLMPSAYEGLALISYEAMSLGVPQIFANVNGQSELITPDTGILIENGPGEETRYAQACLELLFDPDRRARMAKAGNERVKCHFTAAHAVTQYTEIFEEMAELSRKRASEIPHLRPPHINPLHELV